LVPAYWKQLPGFHSGELILWRILLSSISLLPFLLYRNETSSIIQILRSKRLAIGCVTTSLLIGFNWSLYIWAVTSGHIVESSLGYFLNPLLNMALGTFLLRESLNRFQLLACALAFFGVSFLTWQTGKIPWIALLLAISFAAYGYLRKVLRFPTLAATFSETALLSIPALIGLLWLSGKGELHAPVASSSELAWLMLSGLITAIPLLAFAQAAIHLPLTAMGFLQFLSPTLQFLLGVLVYNEPFGKDRWASFAFIWAGLALFLFDLARRNGFTCWPRLMRK